MQHQIKDLAKGEKEIVVTVTVKEQEPYLERASQDLSKNKPIKGFRPGKAPRETVEGMYGAMEVLKHALGNIANVTYGKILQEEKLKVIGQPQINFTKQVPGEDLEYTARVALLPQITLGALDKIEVYRKKVEVTDQDIDVVLKDLQKMRAKETLNDKQATKGDKVEIDFEIKVNGVVIDGGSAKKYPLVLGDGMFIPGFEEKLIGAKAGEKKEFKLKFPENYQPALSGKEGDFLVTVNNIFIREFPSIDDELAKQAGDYKSLNELKEQIKKNVLQDKEIKADRQFEIDVLEKLVELSEFSEIPEILIKNEIHKMSHELEENLSSQNTTLEQYLQRIGKKKEDIESDWREPAIKRVKTALAARQLAEDEKIEASQEEIEIEKERLKVSYADRPDIQENIKSQDFHEYLFHTLTNKQVVEFLKNKVLNREIKK